MSKVQTVRVLVHQRLTAAAEDIFQLFERTVAEYEEQLRRQQKLLDAVLQPQVKIQKTDVQQLGDSQTEWSSGPVQDLGVDAVDEKPLQNRAGGSREAEGRAASCSPPLQDPSPDSDSETDNSCDWGPPSGLSPVQADQDPLSDEDFPAERASLGSGLNGRLPTQSDPLVDGKTFSCSLCGRSYCHKRSLTDHLRLHARGRPFSCSVCHRTFRWQRDLDIHMRVHTGEKPFSCSFCTACFAQKGNLTAHLRVHTGERPFPCTICSKSFADRSTRSRHLRVHTGEKPYSCSLCGRTFTRRGHMRQHMAVHTEEKPYSCSVCGRTFAVQANLQKHWALHSRGSSWKPEGRR